ncbi:MAG: hypothetical protein RMJ44_06965 [Cytophagales bacterium]|nr:hypothetical protein [Bernardetiaceae bacterium]MDW8210813.1 hypothetical protein [Cytophagales bacterium]
MEYATFDESKFPIVIITFRAEEPTIEEFENYLNKALEIYQRKTPVSFVFDCTLSKYLRAELRIKQAEWLKKHKELISTWQKCFVFVMPNKLVRVILDAIMFITPLPAPHVIVKTLEEGLAEATKALQAAGVAVPQ